MHFTCFTDEEHISSTEGLKHWIDVTDVLEMLLKDILGGGTINLFFSFGTCGLSLTV